ncbi:MAG: polysaccharide biosynthesis tyrosine autokinase [Candidatus Nanopelagicales bacterium]
MELRDYVRVLAKHWLAIVVVTVLVTGAVATWTFLQPKVYTATAQMFVAISSRSDSGDPTTGATYTMQRITSYVQLIDSPQVLQPVIDELGLDVDVKHLGDDVSATNPIDTVLINVSASNGSPEKAAQIANAAAVQLGAVIQQLESTAAGDLVPVKATLTDPAEAPPSPSSPRTRINLILGLLVGLALGVGYAFLRESLDTSVRSPDDLGELTGAMPIGIVSFDPEASGKPLVALDQRSTRAEAFRTIRTNLQYVDVDNPPKVIAITSAVPNEGKTTTAVNLAITMAQAGKRVVLVETDLRKPKASSYLGVESELGLTDVLAGQSKLEDALLPWNRDLLTFLPAGHTPPNPSELLASQQFEQVLAQLREEFDQVIVDATPLLPVTDGAIVAKAADGAVVIVRYGKTTREQLTSSLAALEQVGARTLGTTLNFVPAGRRGYGYAYGYQGVDVSKAGSGSAQSAGAGYRQRRNRSNRGSGADDERIT